MKRSIYLPKEAKHKKEVARIEEKPPFRERMVFNNEKP